eukprot:TRINITY_DN55879_c1_g1_i2.p1 TRINITY_DN55879_c1_g1~~TRINITY_DN55879_c1_g1_i2.p1  ORF type:complete len:196 (+),score=14.01 TRINITY_DN55879_c1_g1_i2:96-683(+)
MGDDEAQCQVVYADAIEGEESEFNWVKRPGKAKITYANGSSFEGTFNSERIKQDEGVYIWMGAGGEDDDEGTKEIARYEGNYENGMRNGVGKMTYPNGDSYAGSWVEGKMNGEGSYTYAKTGDIYSGWWSNNKKNGKGTYSFGADKSMLVGEWENGELVSGSWELKNPDEEDGGDEAKAPNVAWKGQPMVLTEAK